MGLKHGMKLAAISGVNGVFSDEDIARVRELALAVRAKQETARERAAEQGVPAKPRLRDSGCRPELTRRNVASLSIC